jgi:DNA (cytosine-5)-methyltransferase 1
VRIGELFAGYGGLGLGVKAVLGGDIAWYSEIDTDASAIFAHHYPDVPNLGDITAIDWEAVEPVDVLTGGFPCTDVSHAGKRAGLNDSTRSGLWAHMAYAIDALRPPLVVIENVRGLLSAAAQRSEHEAAGDVGCDFCDLEDDGSPALRALGAVLGDLAELGYVGRWGGVRAADAGAPHGRFRVFITAWPANADGEHDDRGGDAGPGRRTEPTDGGGDAADADVTGREDRVPGRRQSPEPGWRGAAERRRAGAAAVDFGPYDAAGASGEARGDAGRDSERPRVEPVGLAEPPTDAAGRSRQIVTPGDGGRGAMVGPVAGTGDRDSGGNSAQGVPIMGRGPRQEPTDFGPYTAAVHRWEATLGRPAPPPTEPGRTGQPRLSPLFVEWLMGLEPGWVTGVPGVSRNAQLKALGNGVVPQQAALALRMLLGLELPAGD